MIVAHESVWPASSQATRLKFVNDADEMRQQHWINPEVLDLGEGNEFIVLYAEGLALPTVGQRARPDDADVTT